MNQLTNSLIEIQKIMTYNPDNLQLIRNLKLGITMGDYDVKFNIKKLPGFFYFLFFRKRKIINYLFNMGAVLTGSRALNCYSINDIELFNREPEDWDFLITREQFMKICKDHKIYDFDLKDGKYFLDKSFAVFEDYGISRWFPCLIQLVIVDSLEDYIEVSGKKFSTLTNIIDNKINLVHVHQKHQKDLNNILVNTYYI